jgi:predicted acylesterase/phospholipase RssA
MGIPQLVPPLYYNGDLHVDGGYVNNLPADIMRQRMGAAVVIAVDVEGKDNSAFEGILPYDNMAGISGFDVFWARIRRLFPGADPEVSLKFPTNGEIQFALQFISHANQLRTAISEVKGALCWGYSNTPGGSSSQDADGDTGPAAGAGNGASADAASAGSTAMSGSGGECVDLYLRPPVDPYMLLDYHKYDQIAADALAHSLPVVREWYRRTRRQPAKQQSVTGMATSMSFSLRSCVDLTAERATRPSQSGRE